MSASDALAHLRRKRLWTVADFALFMGIPHKQARAFLKRLDAESGGLLLLKSSGKKPEYTFLPSVLAKVKPEIFERVDSLERRLDELEERVGEVHASQRIITSQVGQNTHDIARIRRGRSAA